MKRMHAYSGSYTTSVLTIIILIIFVLITTVAVVVRYKEDTGNIIADDISRLSEIFHKIDRECHIIGFDYQKNPINFLTIKKGGFVGSEVGSMNLAYPARWQGPYLMDNPTIQTKEYQVVHTKAGYFITPGEGVRLPSGKIIGKDILLDEQADIFAMMQDPNIFMFEGKPLASSLTGPVPPVEDETLAEELV